MCLDEKEAEMVWEEVYIKLCTCTTIILVNMHYEKNWDICSKYGFGIVISEGIL